MRTKNIKRSVHGVRGLSLASLEFPIHVAECRWSALLAPAVDEWDELRQWRLIKRRLCVASPSPHQRSIYLRPQGSVSVVAERWRPAPFMRCVSSRNRLVLAVLYNELQWSIACMRAPPWLALGYFGHKPCKRRLMSVDTVTVGEQRSMVLMLVTDRTRPDRPPLSFTRELNQFAVSLIASSSLGCITVGRFWEGR